LVLVVFFLLAGVSRLAQEAFKHVSTSNQRPTFLLTAFMVAACPSIALLAVRRRKVLPIEMAFGFLMGASNILQTHFILKALQYYDGFIVFLVVSAGSLMLTTVVATGVLGERLTRRSQVGIAVATVSLVLLNYPPHRA
jgi:drug/metabolite transporter (DMT)-like permease